MESQPAASYGSSNLANDCPRTGLYDSPGFVPHFILADLLCLSSTLPTGAADELPVHLPRAAMDIRYSFLLLIVLLFFGAQHAQAQQSSKNIEPRARVASANRPASPDVGTCETGTDTADLDVNNVRARLNNRGALFWDDDENVYTVPKNGSANAVFSSNLWIGGLELERGDLRFAGSTYGPFEYWPGPLDSDGNPPADCSAYDRLYKVSRVDIEALEIGHVSDDIRDWPHHLGAPVEDGDGIPDNYDIEAGDRPELVGDQMVWWVMNDVGNVKEWSETEPIGLEVQVTAFAFDGLTTYDYRDPLRHTTFYKYRVEMKGDEPLIGVYFGLWNDADIGNPTDDFMGSDSLRGMGIMYNGDDHDEGSGGYGSSIPAIGFDFIQGPLVPSPWTTWTDPDGTIHPGSRRLKMTTFIDGNLQSPLVGSNRGEYTGLMGFWSDGSPLTVGGTGFGGTTPTKFMFSGNAADRDFWSEENTDNLGSRHEPGDRSFTMSAGPFNLEKGDVQEVIVAIVWSEHYDRLASYRKVLNDGSYIQGMYSRQFIQRPELDAPVVSATVENERAALQWKNDPSSNNYLHQYDEQSEYIVNELERGNRTYTFEGYQVLQYDSRFDQTGRVVATYDLDNHVKGISVETIDYETGLVDSEIVVAGTDSGVQEYHTVSNLDNYKTYFYGVRAYAHNPHSEPPVIFSPVARVEFTPADIAARDEGTILNSGTGDLIPSVRVTGSGTESSLNGLVYSPQSLTGAQYEFSFYDHIPAGDSVAQLVYDLINTTTNDTLVNGGSILDNNLQLPIGRHAVADQGVSFTITSEEEGFTNFLVTSNMAGPITTGTGPGGSTGGAAGSQGFPVPEEPGSTQQVGPGIWYYTTGDVGTGHDYEDVFQPRSIRNGFDIVIPYDYEIRFTETCYDVWRNAMDAGNEFATPENGCYAYDRFGIFGDDRPQLVPYELWNTGIRTVDDPSDDFRMIPVVIDWEGDGYNLQFFDSSISTNTNDPETDWTYWYLPCDTACTGNDYSPGESGYNRWKDDILAGASSTTHGSEVMARSAFVNLDGGDVSAAVNKSLYLANVVNQDMPEPGTVFRLETTKPFRAGDVFVIDTAPFSPVTNDQATLQSVLDKIGIVPNPYRYTSAYQVNEFQDVARFTNLPDRATIRVFTLSGTLVRTLQKNSPEVTLEWDLTNDYGLPIASGMYLIHVEVPDVGETVIKFGVLISGSSVETL